MSNSLSTKQLYRLDESAVVELVERYRAPLLYFLTGFVRDFAEAEDIVSETVVRLLVKKPALKNENALKTYLYKTARNIAVDRLRKGKREREFLKTAYADTETQYIDDALAKSEEKRLLAIALRQLSTEYRQVLYFYYFEDLSVSELCRVLKKSKKQIYNLLSRAKTALATILKKGGEEDEI